MIQRLKKSKTFWVAFTGITAAVGAFMQDQIDLVTMLTAVGNGLAFIFLRDGVATSGK